MPRLFVLMISFIFFVSLGFAQDLFVSDIDDTIKLANIHDQLEALRYARDDNSRFVGMSELYYSLVQDFGDVKIVYLSNAPSWLMKNRHQEFLVNGLFPVGEYIPRTKYQSENHKLQTLRELIEIYHPKKVVLVGDNGEQDPTIYAQIAKEYEGADIHFYQYIHYVYGEELFGGRGTRMTADQKPFVTSIELAMDLKNDKLLSAESADKFIQKLLPETIRQEPYSSVGVVAFPYFLNCTGYLWKWDHEIAFYPNLSILKELLIERCHMRGHQ